MSNVWKRLQRVGKKAAKYHVCLLPDKLELTCSSSKWQPDKILVTLVRNKRKEKFKMVGWLPGIDNVYEGVCRWNKTDALEFDITVYKGANEDVYQEKEWLLTIHDCSNKDNGKHRLLGAKKMNLSEFTRNNSTSETEIIIKFDSITKKVTNMCLKMCVRTKFLKEGKATDDDMISLQSYASTASSTVTNDLMWELHSDDDVDDDNLSALNGLNDDLQRKIKKHRLLKSSTMYHKSTSAATNAIATNSIGNFSLIDENESTASLSLSPIKSTVPTKQSLTATSSIITQDQSNENESKQEEESVEKEEERSQKEAPQGCIKVTNEDTNRGASPKLTKYAQLTSLNSDSYQLEQTKSYKQTVNNSSSNNYNISINKSTNNPPNNNNNSFTSTELFEWCKQIVSKYSIELSNFSNDWINGIAFCAIIHRYRPKLIDDINKLKKNSNEVNLKLAFKLTDQLKISRVIQLSDIINGKNEVDMLSIVTYLQQIKAYFEKYPFENKAEEEDLSMNNNKNNENNHDLLKKQKPHETQSSSFNKISFTGKSKTLNTDFLRSTETTVTVNNHKVDHHHHHHQPQQQVQTSTPIRSTNKKSESKSSKSKSNSNNNTTISSTTPMSTPKSNKINSPVKSKQPLYESRNQYMNPFDSDDDGDGCLSSSTDETDGHKQRRTSSSIVEIKQNGEIIDAIKDENDENELIDEAIDDLNSSSNSDSKSSSRRHSSVQHKLASLSEDDYKKRAKQMIQMAKHSNNTPQHQQQEQQTPTKYTVMAKQLIEDAKKRNSLKPAKTQTITTATTTINKVNESDSGTNTSSLANNDSDSQSMIGVDYVNNEMNLVEKEQKQLDERAIDLEKQLRQLIKNGNNKAQEDVYIREWLLLVNRKNALIHRQLELEIIQNEKNLEKRCELLDMELRNLMKIDDFLKTEEQRKNEKNLLNELISLVNKRNELIEQLDEENRNLESEEQIDNYIKSRTSFNSKDTKNAKSNCLIQ